MSTRTPAPDLHRLRDAAKVLTRGAVLIGFVLGTAAAARAGSVLPQAEASSQAGTASRSIQLQLQPDSAFETPTRPADRSAAADRSKAEATVTTSAAQPGPAVAVPTAVAQTAATTDIPARVLLAYQNAAKSAPASCRIQWQFLAAFGRIESNHGRFGGSQIGADGVAVPAIYGISLNGTNGTASIVDGTGTADRAAGPMQFISSTWQRWGGAKNVQDIDDAASAAAGYLCAGGRDLSTQAGRHAAALSYNHAEWYAADVLALYAAYLANGPGDTYPVAPPSDAQVAPPAAPKAPTSTVAPTTSAATPTVLPPTKTATPTSPAPTTAAPTSTTAAPTSTTPAPVPPTCTTTPTTTTSPSESPGSPTTPPATTSPPASSSAVPTSSTPSPPPTVCP